MIADHDRDRLSRDFQNMIVSDCRSWFGKMIVSDCRSRKKVSSLTLPIAEMISVFVEPCSNNSYQTKGGGVLLVLLERGKKLFADVN